MSIPAISVIYSGHWSGLSHQVSWCIIES